ncbi:hypothetical protein SBOR_7423 [Sclerotinia borealis F-4128]|uniref:F-box domain-containing protein n=1 Tax=Sclerotinia borealis (strain F-4128) TaxID=1432307 RepID=W9CCA4_SCLBF|nr:hypothetical protein SBOR_7423 [Sclerotinia borealis F-4128]
MSAPPISSFAGGDIVFDLDAAFKESLVIARDVVKGAILKHCDASLDGHNICFTAQKILDGDTRYNGFLTMRDSESSSNRTAYNNNNNIVQLRYSGNTIGPTDQATTMMMMGRMASPSPSSLHLNNNINTHFYGGNSLQNYGHSNFQPQSSFNVNSSVAQTQPELPQVAVLLRAANDSHHRPPYPMLNNNLHSLSSSNQRPRQLQEVSPGIEYPRNLENLFFRSNSILALQNTNPTIRSNVQQQMIAQLQQGSRNFAHQQPYSNSHTAYSGQGSPLNLERSSSNGSLLSNLALPPLAPAQISPRSPRLDNLLIVESRSTTQSRSGTPLDFEMAKNTNPKKRKTQTDEQKAAKKAKVNKTDKADKLELMKDRAKFNLPVVIWMRILEFCPPIFLRKARLINKEWKSWIEDYQSIHINCRRENFGYNMPESVPGLSAKQYVDLLGGKGCMEINCKNKDASRTHWAWKKRWCLKCWKGKIEREDRIQKQHQLEFLRPTMDRLLECIPVSMYDSFGKPHDYVDEAQPQANPTGTPRLYKYYLLSDVTGIIKEYEALTPDPYREDPTHDAQQKAAARQIWEEKMAKLDEDRNKFFEAKKAENEKLMQLVIQIEAAIRERRAKGRKPNDANRESRKSLFIEGAKRDIPDIPLDFVISAKAFKAAIRIFRDGGSERGWRTLMPKIVAEYQEKEKARQATNAASDAPSLANTDELVQMSGNNFGNCGLDNGNFPQIGNHGLKQNAQQSQLPGLLQVQKAASQSAFTNNKSFGIAHTGGLLGYRNNFMGSGSRPSNTTYASYLGGRSLIPSNHTHDNSAPSSHMLVNSSSNVSQHNNGSAVGSSSNFSHNSHGFSTSSLNHVSQNNTGSFVSSPINASRYNGFNPSSLNHVPRNNNGSSLVSGNPSNYTSQNNSGSSVGPSSRITHNNNGSPLVPANPSNVGSSSTPRTSMSIASLITRTQPHQGN